MKGVELAREDDPDPEEEEEDANSVHLGEKVVGKLGKDASDWLALGGKEIRRKSFRIFFTSIFGKIRPQFVLMLNFSLLNALWIWRAGTRY